MFPFSSIFFKCFYIKKEENCLVWEPEITLKSHVLQPLFLRAREFWSLFHILLVQYYTTVESWLWFKNTGHSQFISALMDISSIIFQNANKFDSDVVLNQLRYSGMLETVKIRRAGFPVRRTFQDFLSRWDTCPKNPSLKSTDSPSKYSLTHTIISRGPYLKVHPVNVLELINNTRDFYFFSESANA